jgi:hypothetical protein
MSFNAWLRNLVYGKDHPRVNNPLKNLPAAFTGTTWHGTEFDDAPTEPIQLVQEAIPWELSDESHRPLPWPLSDEDWHENLRSAEDKPSV